MGGGDEHPERIDKKYCEEPDRGDDQLRPEKLVDADGESEHEIALVCHEVFIKPADHHNDGEDERGENGKNKAR